MLGFSHPNCTYNQLTASEQHTSTDRNSSPSPLQPHVNADHRTGLCSLKPDRSSCIKVSSFFPERTPSKSISIFILLYVLNRVVHTWNRNKLREPCSHNVVPHHPDGPIGWRLMAGWRLEDSICCH